MKKNWMQLFAVLFMLVCFAGCFDRRELDTLGIVVGAAIDQGEKEDELRLTLQFANVSAGQSSKSAGGNSKSGGAGGVGTSNISNSGRNINYIIRDFERKVSRMIYTAHNQVIILGEEHAKSGVRDSLDFFARAPEARMTPFVVVAHGEASRVLEVEPEFEKLLSTELWRLVKDQKVTSEAPVVTEFEFIGKILSKTASPVAPMVTVLEDQEKKRLSVEGAAVFKDDKMVGELDKKETRGLLWVTGEVETGIFNMGVLGQWASLEIREASSKLTAEITPEGAIAMRVEIHETSGIGDQKGKVNLADPEADTALLNAAEQAILDEAESALKKAKELGADIFGFGDEIARKYPRRWAEMEDRWDELFQDIEVRFEIKTRLDGTGRLSHPITPEDR